MLLQFTYNPINHPDETCVLALCDTKDKEVIEEETREFFKRAGCDTDEPNWGKFVARRPSNREKDKIYTIGDFFFLVACTEINNTALLYGIKQAEYCLGYGPTYDDYLRMSNELEAELVEKTPKHVETGYEEVLCETTVYLEDDGGEPPYDGNTWPDIDVCIETLPEGTKFKPGDKIQIIARKV